MFLHLSIVLHHKFKLAKIMNAVVGADLLQKKDFRESVFYSLSPGHQDLIKKEFQLKSQI